MFKEFLQWKLLPVQEWISKFQFEYFLSVHTNNFPANIQSLLFESNRQDWSISSDWGMMK